MLINYTNRSHQMIVRLSSVKGFEFTLYINYIHINRVIFIPICFSFLFVFAIFFFLLRLCILWEASQLSCTVKVEISSISLSVSQVYRVDELPANGIPSDILDDILGKLRFENFKFSSYHSKLD